MGIKEALLLGFIQGVTEFLPVSSSGHLAIAQQLLTGFRQPGILFDVMLHGGTLISLTIYFRRELKGLVLSLFLNPYEGTHRSMLLKIAITLIPTGIIGLSLKGPAERMFTSMAGVSIFLIVTGVIVITSDRIRGWSHPLRKLTYGDAFLVGVSQGLAVFPGLSRSGVTISSSLLRGIGREEAARFSFLISIPAILGAIAVEANNIGGLARSELVPYAAGTGLAALVGYLAIMVVMKAVTGRRFSLFGIYCLALGGTGLALTMG